MKYERMVRKWEEAKETLRSLGRGDQDHQSTNSSQLPTPTSADNNKVVDNFIGRMSTVSSSSTNIVPTEEEEREHQMQDGDGIIMSTGFERELKAFLMDKVNELVGLLQYADSRAVHFYREVSVAVVGWVGP
jgi:hypothetical protein